MPMSMWMPAPGQTWFGAATSFLVSWIAMMAAMMLPSIAPALWQCGRAMRDAHGARIAWLITIIGVAYLAVWTLIGAAVFPVGAAVATLDMREPLVSRLGPFMTALMLVASALLQLSPWKARHLACVRGLPTQHQLADAGSAWKLGVRLGVHCSQCSAGLMAILLLLGMTSMTMSVITLMMTFERLAPNSRLDLRPRAIVRR